MSLWEVILFLSLSRWLGAPEPKWWVIQRLQKCSLPLNLSGLAGDRLVLSALWRLWSTQHPRCCCSSSHKRGYGRVWQGAFADMGSTRKSFVSFQMGFLLMALVPRGLLHQPQPACEVAKNTRSRKPRSGGGEACCRQWRTDRSHVVLHSPLLPEAGLSDSPAKWPKRQEHTGH